jgi:cytochrome b561
MLNAQMKRQAWRRSPFAPYNRYRFAGVRRRGRLVPYRQQKDSAMPATFRDHSTRYGLVALTLHWLVAALLIANLYTGLEFSDLPRSDPGKLPLFHLHASIGLTVLVLSVLRLFWRWAGPVPPPPKGLAPWMRIAGRGMHYFFYLAIIVIPLAGWLMVSAGSDGRPIPFFGLFDWPSFPILSGMAQPSAHPWRETFETLHVWLAWAMIVLIPVHVLAALYHHFVRDDNVLLRMLPFVRLRSGL